MKGVMQGVNVTFRASRGRFESRERRMARRRSVVLGLAWLLLGVATAYPAEPSGDGGAPELTEGVSFGEGPFTLEQLQQFALEQNPTLVQARAETWKAYGRWRQAGLYPNPHVGYSGQEIGNAGTAGQQGFFVSQRFVTGGKLELSRQVAAREQQQAQQMVTAQEFRVVNGVRAEFYELLTVERKVQLATELLEIAREFEELNQRRFEALQVSRIDVLQSRLERERVGLVLETLRAERDAVVRRLRVLTGLPVGGELNVAGDLEHEIPDLEWDDALVRLVESSPLIARAEAGAARAAAAWQRARAEPIPDITVQAGAMRDFASNLPIANVQLSLPIPIFDRNQGAISATEAEWVRAAHEVERIRMTLERELADVFQRYAQQRIRVMKYNNEIIPASWETLELSRQALRAGEIDSLQFLTVQRNHTEFNREYVESLGGIWREIVAIDGLLLLDGLQSPDAGP
jgi:outer membrane protein, heavy metal efflux system